MRMWAIAAVVMITGLGVALAQEEPTPFNLEVAATRSPPGYFYPTQALERGIKGEAWLCCAAGEGDGLSCRNAGPEDRHGFYLQAQRLLRATTLTPASAESLRRQTREVSLRVTFDFTPGFYRNGILNIENAGYCEATPTS